MFINTTYLTFELIEEIRTLKKKFQANFNQNMHHAKQQKKISYF